MSLKYLLRKLGQYKYYNLVKLGKIITDYLKLTEIYKFHAPHVK